MDGKCRKIVASLIPAAAAIAFVVDPPRPRSPNTEMATSRICARRSAALNRLRAGASDGGAGDGASVMAVTSAASVRAALGSAAARHRRKTLPVVPPRPVWYAQTLCSEHSLCPECRDDPETDAQAARL